MIASSQTAFAVVKWAGVAYLVLLAVQLARGSNAKAAESHRNIAPRPSRAFRQAAFVNLLNPKVGVFFLAFLPQFIDPASGSATWQMIMLSAVFMAMTFIVFIIYGQFAAFVGEQFLRSRTAMRWMRRTMAAAFAGFGLRLALAER